MHLAKRHPANSADMELKIAVAQFEIIPGDPLRNLEQIEDLVAEAAGQGAQLVVFPEDAICGPLAWQTMFLAHAPKYLQRMQALALKHGVDLVPGTWAVPEGGRTYNQAHYINADGTVAGIYRKIHLWETEKAAITPGAAVSVFPTRFGQVGLVICWDISFPPLFTAMNAQGVRLVIAPSYWSFPEGTEESRKVMKEEINLIDSLCISRAFENNIVFVYCNGAGTTQTEDPKTVLSGRSQITHPLEKVIARCKGNEPELLVAPVSLPDGAL